MKQWAFLIIVLAVIAGASAENYVRWNSELDECVYFYDGNFSMNDTFRGQCFVPEEHCTSKMYVNEIKSVDQHTCYHIPRKEQGKCQNFTEGDLIRIQADASDPDANIGPAGKLLYSYDAPFNQNGEWQTKRGDAGSYTTKITVSDGQLNETTKVCFIVNLMNVPPTLSVSDITVQESETAKLNVSCGDENGEAVTLSFAGKMHGPAWHTTYDDAGVYNVTVTCTDTSGMNATKTVKVTVLDKNRPPTITAIATKG